MAKIRARSFQGTQRESAKEKHLGSCEATGNNFWIYRTYINFTTYLSRVDISIKETTARAQSIQRGLAVAGLFVGNYLKCV